MNPFLREEVAESFDSPEVDEWIKDAAAGDRMALSRLYGHAGAWLESGKVPPPKLLAWLVGVVNDIRDVAYACRQKESEDQRNKWLLGATGFRRGRGRPASRRSAMAEEWLAREVFHALTWEGAKNEAQAVEHVVAMHKRLKLPPSSPKQIEAAWRKHRNKFPEFHR